MSRAYKQIISERDLVSSIDQLAQTVYDDFKDEELLAAAIVINGAIMFGSRFITSFPRKDIITGTVKCSIYKDTKNYSSDSNIWAHGFPLNIATPNLDGYTVLVLDDIYETGNTMQLVCNKFRTYGAKKVIPVVMCYRPQSNIIGLEPKYYANKIDIPDFLYGYGLDNQYSYRGLQGIFIEE